MSKVYLIFIGLFIICFNHDAAVAETNSLKCLRNQFKCADGSKCVSMYVRCDGDYQCDDRSDELECSAHCCPAGTRRCAGNRQCIPGLWACDGIPDCNGHSDEKYCAPSDSGCLTHQFRCSDGLRCIPVFNRCDNSTDCIDGSDEAGCDAHECLKGYHRCGSGRCVHDMFVCDGVRNCYDGSDEDDCDSSHSDFISQNEEHSYLPSSSESDVCMTPKCLKAAADVFTSLDETVDPCDDFYSFACGGWMKRHEVSDYEPELNIIKSTRKDVDRKLREILESKFESSDPPFAKLLKDFYKTCVDLGSPEKRGYETLKEMLSRLGGWPVVEGNGWNESTFDWVDALISFRKLGYNHNILLNLFVSPLKTTVHVLCLQLFAESGEYMVKRHLGVNLTLGLDDPETNADYRRMLRATTLLGADASTAETELREARRFKMDLINIVKSDERDNSTQKEYYSIEELGKEMPMVPWLKIINGLLLNYEVYENETIYNANHKFLINFTNLIASTEKRVIANYMLGEAVLQSIDYLFEDIEEVKDVSSKKFKGAEKSRWKQCLSVLDTQMKIGMSSLYVRKYFSEESKDEVITIMKYIQKEALKILEEKDWIEEKTKKNIIETAMALEAYIGYPDEFLNDTFMMKLYENLTTTNNSYLENILSIRKWRTDKIFSDLRGSIKNREGEMYGMSSSKYNSLIKVNAGWFPWENSIVIPAGILQNPFYDKHRPNYLNFGAIGNVIGHEITHGFAVEGWNFDKDLNKVNISDKDSEKHYRKKVECLIHQYSNYTTDIGWKVNGKKTQGENIADNGAMKEAYWAYQSWTKDHGVEPLLPGVNYTQNQLFWLSAAQIKCSKIRPERLKEILIKHRHSPPKYRIIGAISNRAEFSKDFRCPPDAPMNPKHKCEVW